jgi:hypothetical protein
MMNSRVSKSLDQPDLKSIQCRRPAVKLSDNYAKALGPPFEIERYGAYSARLESPTLLLPAAKEFSL